jgi:hypothetical protein
VSRWNAPASLAGSVVDGAAGGLRPVGHSRLPLHGFNDAAENFMKDTAPLPSGADAAGLVWLAE